MKYKLAELFCGPGGLGSAALKSVVKTDSGKTFSIKPVWANDIDRDACDTYLKNIHGIEPDAADEEKDQEERLTRLAGKLSDLEAPTEQVEFVTRVDQLVGEYKALQANGSSQMTRGW